VTSAKVLVEESGGAVVIVTSGAAGAVVKVWSGALLKPALLSPISE
jgi:hypothetical protein